MHETATHASGGQGKSLFKLLGPLAATALLAFAVLSCSTPSEPREQDPSAPRVPNNPTSKGEPQVTLEASATKVEVNGSTTITIIVRGLENGELPAPVGVATDLGNFGTDANGSTITSLECNVSGTSCAVTDLNATAKQATITFYAGANTGTANVVATMSSYSANLLIEVAPVTPLFLSSVSPNVGDPAGGETVKIFGNGLEDGARVTFGGALATFNSIAPDESYIEVTTPKSPTPVAVGSTLVVDVKVEIPDTGNGAQTDTLTGAFTYAYGSDTALPVILFVDPPTGPNKGGIPVTITGRDFEQDNAFVFFGVGSTTEDFEGVPASVTLSTATELQVTLPAAPTAYQNTSVDVLVRNRTSGAAALARSIFIYVDEDVVTDIQPREYSYLGSDAIGDGRIVKVQTRGIDVDADARIQLEFGGQFQATCRVGAGQACRIVESSLGSGLLVLRSKVLPATVTHCAPPSGTVVVTDALTGETSVGPEFKYTVDEPAISSVSPSSDFAAGGTAATLSGTFHPTTEPQSAVTLLVDGQAATITSYSASAIGFTVPSFTGSFDEVSCGTNGTKLVPKTVDVEVSYDNTGCSATKVGAFTYTPTATEQTCVEAAETPVANFSYAFDTTDPTNLTVTFTDASTNAATWSWSFGNGTTASTVGPHTVVYNYDTEISVTATLTVTNSDGSASDTATQTITVGKNVDASFSFTVGSPNSACTSFPVTFTNDAASTNSSSTTYAWDFDGNGTIDSTTSSSTTFNYSATGTYTATLTATLTGSQTLTASSSQTVTISLPAPVADFTSSTADTAAPWTVTFTDASSSCPETWNWVFGNGQSDSTQTPPAITYNADGTYEVVLTVTNASGSDSITKTLNLVTPTARPSSGRGN